MRVRAARAKREMRKVILKIIIFGFLVFAGCLDNAVAQALDISSGGSPAITGALGGSVTGSSSVLNDLVVTVNFGEVSPLNTNSIIKVVVPVGIRSNQGYMVTATVTGGTNVNPQAIQRSDIGFGINSFRAMGSNSRVCTQSTHIISPPFNNDPSTSTMLNAAGRATYLSDLSDIGLSTVILSGPRLSNGNNRRQTDDGYIFDAIFTLTPQFFAAGTTGATLTLSIAAATNNSC